MTISSRKTAILVLATAVAAGGLFFSEKDWSEGGPVSSAEARVGRPLTPMSYAGVARRTTRRAVAVGAAGAAAYGAYSSCSQVVDAYGQITTQCY
ncbi:hypothetical protein [Bradyrhizobium sp.]|jgi:hypothetical protein|uniref:hypothetical protein n=1 Tax=Bradyrhizobium sp. TaxID=376 RepID=UPI003BAF0C47